MEQVQVDGLAFDVRVEGPPDGAPVLLLHGFPQTSHSWRLVMPALHEAGLRTIAPDQRGYSPGARPVGVEHYRMPALVADAVGLLDALGIERAHVVGHDWGAAVAWQLAARHADRVRTLTAVSVPHPVAFAEALMTDEDQRARSQYMRDFGRPGFDEVLLADDAALLRGALGGIPQVDVDHVVAVLSAPGALAAALSWYAAQDVSLLEGLGPVTAPTLHVWSDADAALGRVATEATAKHVEGPYRLVVLPGVSHWVPEEAADRLAAELVAHLCG